MRASNWRSFYTPEQLVKYLVNVRHCLIEGYLIVGIGRALNYLLNDQRYNGFLMLDPSVAFLDPTYISPVLVMLLNYLLVGKSDHPFLVHLRQRKLVAWNIAFMSGLAVSIMPAVRLNATQLYNSTYFGFILMHILLRSGKSLSTRYREHSIRSKF